MAENWLVNPNLAGTQEIVLQRTLDVVGQRSPVSLSFKASGSDDSFTTNVLEARGDIVMGRGAQIATDPGASVSFDGQTVSIRGSVFAPGGSITVKGAGRFPVPPDEVLLATEARPTVYIGPESTLSAAGAAVFEPDDFGRRIGTLYPGGSITVSGNIVAEAGSLLDVSGASTIFDVHPWLLGEVANPSVPVSSGLNSPLWKTASVPVRVDSDAGSIDLQGSQMLFTDATLRGFAGGPTALGGKLSIFSGRFYPADASRTSADINLVVTQNGRTIARTNRRADVGVAVLDEAGARLGGMGYFAADRFQQGGFDSLDLGFKFIEADPIAYGGNVEFRGPVSITARGDLRVAAGGVIQGNAPVTLTSAYFAVGQPFRAPLHPDDQVSVFLESSDRIKPYQFAPTFGPGSLTVKADSSTSARSRCKTSGARVSRRRAATSAETARCKSPATSR